MPDANLPREDSLETRRHLPFAFLPPTIIRVNRNLTPSVLRLSYFVGFACAISLAPACGERTVPTSEGPRRVTARLEFEVVDDCKPSGLLAFDLDGDGRDELVTITSTPGSIQIQSGITSTFARAPDPLVFSIENYALGPVWVGGARPASKDAPAFIAYASRTVPGVSVVDLRKLWTTKPGSVPDAAWHLALDRRPRVLAAGDLDHDGKPELAVITIDDDLLIVRSPTDVAKMRLADSQATCARFSADGTALFVGFQGTRRVVRYARDPKDATKLAAVASADLAGLPRALDEFDAFGDGKSTLVVAGGDENLWTFDTSAGGLTPIALDVKSGTIPIDVMHGALDASGRPLLVTIALNGQQAITTKLEKSAQPKASVTATDVVRTYAGQHPVAGAIGDFDGDKKLDLAVANSDAKRITILFGDGAGGFQVAQNAKAGRGVHCLAVGDLDGDKKLDVVALNAGEGTLSVLANRNGKLADYETQGLAQSADALQLVDLDGDGHLDAAFLQKTESALVLTAYFGDGKGRLWQRAEVTPVAVGAKAGDLLVADIDGNGTLEAIVADPASSTIALVRIERVKGPGIVFGAARKLEIESGPRALALVDADGDARPEIAVALGGPGKRLGIALLRAVKAADGALALEEFRYIATTDAATRLAVADFDQNGFADIAVLTSKTDGDNAVRVEYQASDRSWSSSVPLATGYRPYALRAGDLDGDGRIDLACTAQNSHQVNVWLNVAGSPPTFVRMPDLGAGTGPLDLALADLDGDGRLEILVANSFRDDVSVIRSR
jgi:hypothetical protein